MTDKLLTAEQVAEWLGIPESWVRRETRAGRIPFVALGRYRRYDRAKVLAWVEGLSAGGNGSTTYRRHHPADPA